MLFGKLRLQNKITAYRVVDKPKNPCPKHLFERPLELIQSIDMITDACRNSCERAENQRAENQRPENQKLKNAKVKKMTLLVTVGPPYQCIHVLKQIDTIKGLTLPFH